MPVRTPLRALAAGERTLDREASHYLCRVLRLREGERLVLFDPETRLEADAVIVEASSAAARVQIEAPRAALVVATAPLVLVYALAKGDKVDAVVRDATELGATRVIVTRTERAVVKADGDRAEAKLARWKRVAEQAARQCGRSDPPAIDGVLAWGDALAEAASAEACFCLDPRSAEPLGPPLTDALVRGKGVSFAIGPEGGLTEAELETAREAGFAPVAIGAFVLRTETVAAAVLGAVRILLGS